MIFSTAGLVVAENIFIRKKSISLAVNYFFNDLGNSGSKEIDLYFDGSVFSPFLNIDFSFSTFQAL